MIWPPNSSAPNTSRSANPMLKPIRICWATTRMPAGLIGSIAGIAGSSGTMAQVSANASINRTRRGKIRELSTGATLIRAATRANGHRKLPTQAAISAVLISMAFSRSDLGYLSINPE